MSEEAVSESDLDASLVSEEEYLENEEEEDMEEEGNENDGDDEDDSGKWKTGCFASETIRLGVVLTTCEKDIRQGKPKKSKIFLIILHLFRKFLLISFMKFYLKYCLFFIERPGSSQSRSETHQDDLGSTSSASREPSSEPPSRPSSRSSPRPPGSPENASQSKPPSSKIKKQKPRNKSLKSKSPKSSKPSKPAHMRKNIRYCSHTFLVLSDISVTSLMLFSCTLFRLVENC